jgi:hypothetical protein
MNVKIEDESSKVAQVDGLITSLVSSYTCILKYIFLKLV